MLFSRQQGFTLIEIGILLTIVSILAVIAIPSFIKNVNYRRISLTADELYSALRFARSEAIKENNLIFVSFTTGDTWCYGINVNSPCNCLMPATCNLKTGTYSKPNQINLMDTFPSNFITFEGSHGSANTNGTITLTLYGDTPYIKITVTRLGNLQICSSYEFAGYTAC